MEQNNSEIKEQTIENVKKWYTATELLKQPDAELWLLESLIPIRGLVCITGPSDVGKSTFVKQLALEISRQNSSFLGKKLNPRHGDVIYVSSEDDNESVSRVLKKQAKGLSITSADNINFMFDFEDLLSELGKYIEQTKRKPVAVIGDSFGDFFRGNPNDWSSVRTFLNEIRSFALNNDCCFIFLHHNVKYSENASPNKNRLNGSQSIEAKMRSVMELRKGNSANERLLTLLKGNYVEQSKKEHAMVLMIETTHLLFSTDGSMINTSEIGEKVSRYDKEIWHKRIRILRKEGLSYEKIKAKFEVDYPGEDVPGLTWIKNQGIEIDSQSEDGEVDRPTDQGDGDSQDELQVD